MKRSEATSEPPKVARTCGVLYILTSKCASRHNGVHFFDISTAKSGPELVCFVHFDFKMCFAPQRRALFRHLNFQKWSGAGVFCTFDLEMCFAPQRRALFRHRNFQKWSDNGVFRTFWLGNVLRATTACAFSSLIWPAGSAPAALASLLFDPPEPQITGKHSESRLSYLFAHLYLLSSDSFSSTLLSSNLSLLSASALLCFSSVHIVRSLTSKLPSIKYRFVDRPFDPWSRRRPGVPRRLPPGRVPPDLPWGQWGLPLPKPQNHGDQAPAWLFFPSALTTKPPNKKGAPAAPWTSTSRSEVRLLSQSLGG